MALRLYLSLIYSFNSFLFSALLSHQMEQLLKLKNELAEGRREVDGIKGDVRLMEQEIKAQELMIRGQPSKMVVSSRVLNYSFQKYTSVLF